MKRLYTVISILLLISCTNSQKNLETEKKAIADSVKNALISQIEIEKKEEEEKRFQEERKSKVIELNSQIENLQSELITEKAKLIDIEKPKFLRSAAERENQIRSQNDIITKIESSIENIKATLNNLQSASISVEDYKVEELIGCWFVPHSATINIKFERNGRFKFNDYNSQLQVEETLRGSWELSGSSLSLLYDDRPKQNFQFHKGKNGDTNYYIEKSGYYFVKSGNCE